MEEADGDVGAILERLAKLDGDDAADARAVARAQPVVPRALAGAAPAVAAEVSGGGYAAGGLAAASVLPRRRVVASERIEASDELDPLQRRSIE